MKKLIILFFLVSICPNNASAVDWHTTPDKWKEPRIFHSEYSNYNENDIRISHAQIDNKILENKEKKYSPNKACWFVICPADVAKPDHTSTDILVFNERNYIIKMGLHDHIWEPAAKWINEKLLYVEVWWGRILGTYFIYDVEKEKVIIREMVHDGVIPFQQWQQNKQK